MIETFIKSELTPPDDSSFRQEFDVNDTKVDHRDLNDGATTGIISENEGNDITALKCINERYEGLRHPETNIPYVRTTLEHNGNICEGVFPEFEATFDANIPEEKFNATDREHFSECNDQLKYSAMNDHHLASKFTEDQFDQILSGYTPEGYTWHHSEEPGKLQLVDTTDHESTRHTGGRAIWGGGGDART